MNYIWIISLMNKINTTDLIKLQIFVSLLINYFLRILDVSKIFCLTTLSIILMIHFNFWPETNLFRLILIMMWISINSFFFFKELEINSNKKTLTFPSLVKVLEKKLDLENNELNMIEDKFLSGREALWKLAFKTNLNRVIKNYKFKIQYFFLFEKKIPIYYLATLIGWACISFFLFYNNSYKNILNSITPEIKTNIINEPSINIWIYPPKDSKKELMYFEKNQMKYSTTKETYFVESKSKILINFYNVDLDKLNITFNKKKINKSKLEKIDFKTINYEEFLSNGTYSIILNNKVFHEFSIILDQNPQINFVSLPEISKQSIFSFSYNLLDENNKKSWLEINTSSSPDNDNIDFNKFDRIYSKPTHFITLNNRSNNKEKKNVLQFSKDLSYLPIFGNNVDLRLKSFDKNDQHGSSEVVNLFVPKLNFIDPFANELIKIRDKLFFTEEIIKAINDLESLKNFDNYKLINKRIIGLVGLLKKDMEYGVRLESALREIWRLAIFIENNSVQTVLKKIRNLKGELEILLKKDSSEKEISQKINELELLIRKYNSITKTYKNQNKNEELNELDNDYENLNQTKNTVKKRAEDLITQIERLLKKDKKSELLAKKVISNLKKTYKLQKDLTDKSHKKSQSLKKINDLKFEQDKIINLYVSSKDDLLKLLPGELGLINNALSHMKKSNEWISKENINKSIASQVNSLKNIKEIYRKLRENSAKNSEEKSEVKNKSKKRSFEDSNEIEIPLIFETNNFNKIIDKIRKMSGEEGRNDNEKNYLKSLLPNF